MSKAVLGEQQQHDVTTPATPDAAATDLFDSLRAAGRSLADVGLQLLKQLPKNPVSRLTQIPEPDSVINMNTKPQDLINPNTSQENDAQGSTIQSGSVQGNNASQLLRQQLPGLTRKLLGKRFNTVNKIASLVMPEGSFDKASDQVLELLADFASNLSNSNQVLEEAGVGSLADLQKDTERSGRLARALSEKNRYIAMAQGAISGATGVVGAAADIPFSMILVFRTVYLTGRAYGFELNRPQDRALIFKAVANADLSLIAEKQAIFFGLRNLGNMLSTGDLQGLQSLLGSTTDIEPLMKVLSDDAGRFKWRLSSPILNKVTPLIGGTVGFIYNSRLLNDVSENAAQVFRQARQQALGQSSEHGSTALEDKVVNPETPENKQERQAQEQAQQELQQNDEIVQVELAPRSKQEEQPLSNEAQDEKIHEQIEALAEQMIDDEDGQTENRQAENKQAEQEEGQPAEQSSDKTANTSKRKTRK